MEWSLDIELKSLYCRYLRDKHAAVLKERDRCRKRLYFSRRDPLLSKDIQSEIDSYRSKISTVKTRLFKEEEKLTAMVLEFEKQLNDRL